MRPSRRAVDLALAGILAAGAIVESLVAYYAEGPWWASVLLGLAFGAAFLPRRRAPVLTAAAFGSVSVAMSAWTMEPDESITILVGLFAAGYPLGRWGGRRDRIVGAIVLAAFVAIVEVMADAPVADVFFPILLLVAAGIVGAVVRDRATLVRSLAERTHELEAERDAREQEAVLEERRRIARELHDVVAHTVSVMVVQAGGARRMAVRDPARSLEALDAIDATGRGALLELQRLLGLLRPGAEDESALPTPGLGGLEALVDRARGAGLPVELAVEGDARALPAGPDLAAYRVVQEALTNTLKHAGPATASVVVHWRDDEVELVVADTGHGAAGPRGEGSRAGLAGMRERMAMYGGTLEAGPRVGGTDGFEVRARLPLRREEVHAA